MSEQKKYGYLYDVKEEIVDRAKEYLDVKYPELKAAKIKTDREHPVERLCYYWLSAELEEEALKYFDCDRSGYMMKKYFEEYPWKEEASLIHRLDAGGVSSLKIGGAYYTGDTLTSAWSVLKQFYRFLTGDEIRRKDPETLQHILLHAGALESRMEAYGATRFFRLIHTEGNMMPVPEQFNRARAHENYAEWDQWDLSLQFLYDFYKWYEMNRSGLPADDLQSLVEVYTQSFETSLCNAFSGSKQKNRKTRETLFSVLEWLVGYDGWGDFVASYVLYPFLEGYDSSRVTGTDDATCQYLKGLREHAPEKFFHIEEDGRIRSRSRMEPYPSDESGWKEYFRRAADMIEERGRLFLLRRR